MLNTRLLLQFSQFLYFLLLMIFVVFVFIYQKSADTQVHIYIVLLFSFLLLPVFEGIINVLFKGGALKEFFSDKGNIVRLSVFIGGIIFFLLMGKFSFTLLLLLLLIYTVSSKIDGRIFFVGALFIFLYVAFYLLFGQSELAEKLSIYAYYLLIAGVAHQVLENIIPIKPTK